MGALSAAALACASVEPADPAAIATAVAATLTSAAPAALPSPSPRPVSPTGTVSGRVCYPSEGIPPMTAYFSDVETHAVFTLPIAQNQASYSIELPPGDYFAYAWVDDLGIGGSYSQAVPCGLTASCTDHSLLAVNVSGGVATSDVDLCDWYGGAGTVPTPPGAPPPTAPPAETPPPGGVSLNCDATYQRVRLTDAGAAGRTLWVDRWDGAAWANVWSAAGGDPNVRQIEPEAGAYPFLGCERLIVLPIRYSGSGAYLELSISRWNGSGLSEVYRREGTHGVWSKTGDTIQFEESLYLFDEPTCCPCHRRTARHMWNGTAFLETGATVVPTYSGTPPPECSSG